MTKAYHPYPNYKESGAEYLGKIPSNWSYCALKRVVDNKRQITYGIVQAGPNIKDGVPYIRPVDMTEENGIKPHSELLRTTIEIASSYGRSEVKDGDLVCSIGPSFGKLMVVPRNLNGANLTQGTARVAINSSYSTRFFFWCLRAPSSFQQWESSIGGATFRALNLGPLSETLLPIPPVPDQHTIAAFLDYETARIDTLIAKQQRLIKLLKEKRQAVISHAVTKGLNPDAPMKDSGVEWLGQVPEHWGVKRLFHVVEDLRQIMYGIVLPGPNVSDGVLIVKGGDVKPGRLRADSLCRTTKEIEANYKRSRLLAGDLVYSIRGTIGDVQIVPKEIEGANLTQDAARIAPAAGYSNIWLTFVMESSSSFCQLEVGSLGAAVKGINIRDLKKAVIPVPPIEEREKIARYLNTTLDKLQQLQHKALAQVKLLQERRTALISAAVTGKIDVRNWSPTRQSAEPEPLMAAESRAEYQVS